MEKILKRLSLLFAVALTVTGFVSCDDNDDKEEEVHTPAITVSQTSAGTTVADIDYTVADADKAVYKVVEEGEALPTVDELLADSTAKSLGPASHQGEHRELED